MKGCGYIHSIYTVCMRPYLFFFKHELEVEIICYVEKRNRYPFIVWKTLIYIGELRKFVYNLYINVDIDTQVSCYINL